MLRFDPSDPAVFGDPYPEYARLRAAGPFARGFGGQLVLSRHEDISAALRDKKLTKLLPAEYFEALVGIGPSSAFLARMQELFHERRVTRTLGKGFNPKLRPALADFATATVERLLAPALDTGRFDAVADLGTALPVIVVCELFGIPEGDRESFRQHVADMVVAYNDSVLTVDQELATSRHAAADKAVSWQQDYLSALVAERRAAPGEDLISALVAARDDGEPGGGEPGGGGAGAAPGGGGPGGARDAGALDDQAIVDSVIMSFYAGFETAMAMITTGLAELAKQPDQWARLRADRSLIPTAVEEFVRYDAPIQIGVRRVLAPTEIAGRPLRVGRLLVLLLGSGNHDEAVFDEPHRVDIGRTPNPHLGYGGGTYYCLGAALARLEGAAVLDTMARRCATLAAAGPPVRRPRFNFRTYSSVPLAVTAA